MSDKPIIKTSYKHAIDGKWRALLDEHGIQSKRYHAEVELKRPVVEKLKYAACILKNALTRRKTEEMRTGQMTSVSVRSTNPSWRGLKGAVAVSAALAVFATNLVLTDKDEAYSIIDNNTEQIAGGHVTLDSFIGKPGSQGSVGDFYFHNKTSEHFQNLVMKGWDDVPKPFKDLLKINQYSREAATSMLAAFHTNPSFDHIDGRKFTNQSGGAAIHNGAHKRKIIITEFYSSVNATSDESLKRSPTPRDVFTGKWKTFSDPEVIGVTQHEIGHAVNHTFGFMLGTKISDLPAFLKAYDKDVQNMGGPQGAVEKGYSYFAHPERNDQLNRDEAFAELFRLRFKQCAPENEKAFVKNWSNCASFVNGFIDSYVAASQQGLGKTLSFIDGLDGRSDNTGKVRPTVSHYGYSLLFEQGLASDVNAVKQWYDVMPSSLARFAVERLKLFASVDPLGEGLALTNTKVNVPIQRRGPNPSP